MTPTPTAAARVSGMIKALEWDCHPDAEYDPRCDEHYGGKQNDLSGKNEYDIYPHPCADGLYVLDVMGSRTDKDFISVSAAKAAAQADYESRILAAIQPDPEPQTVAWLVEDLLGLIKPPVFATNVQKHVEGIYSNPKEFKVSPLYATTSSAGTVSVEAAIKALSEIERATDCKWTRDKASAALRALAGERGR